MLPPRTRASLTGSAGAASLSGLPWVAAVSLFPSPNLVLPHALHQCIKAGAVVPFDFHWGFVVTSRFLCSIINAGTGFGSFAGRRWGTVSALAPGGQSVAAQLFAFLITA